MMPRRICRTLKCLEDIIHSRLVEHQLRAISIPSSPLVDLIRPLLLPITPRSFRSVITWSAPEFLHRQAAFLHDSTRVSTVTSERLLYRVNRWRYRNEAGQLYRNGSSEKVRGRQYSPPKRRTIEYIAPRRTTQALIFHHLSHSTTTHDHVQQMLGGDGNVLGVNPSAFDNDEPR
ncbi:hypothetical protein WG66_016101 [Moniliophthora roreri]|nr:hypothetical protein WG66_016101 [Moniliophthora roreri]